MLDFYLALPQLDQFGIALGLFEALCVMGYATWLIATAGRIR